MGIRGELFSTKVVLNNRTYFFNVKENRMGDVFMTIVESKPSESDGFDRHQVVLFADDVSNFLKGFEQSLAFVEKEAMARRKAKRMKDREAGHGAPRRESRSRQGDGPDSGAPSAGKKKVYVSKASGAEGPRPPRPGKAATRAGKDGAKPGNRKEFAKKPKRATVRSVKRDPSEG